MPHRGEFPATPMAFYDTPDSDIDSDSDVDNDDTHAGSRRFVQADLPWTKPEKRAQHKAWLPFARFLGQLPALKDLVYACTHQVPACILAALHDNSPQTRLHVRGFALRSLYQEGDQLHDISSDDLTLATSPCLYSIHATCEPHNWEGRSTFNLEVIKKMVSGAAPGLRRVHIVQLSSPVVFNPAAPVIQTPEAPWRGFFLDSSSSSAQTSPLARLESLTLSGFGCSPNDLLAWNNRADFSCLLRLEISYNLSLQALEALASMAAEGKFRSLRTLGLQVGSEVPDENNPETLDSPTSLFLEAISQLNSLDLYGRFGPLTVQAALHRHGPTLRKLHLRSVTPNHTFNPIERYSPDYNPFAHDIAALCPRLDDLSVQVQRDQGGPDEISAYRALGALPRLRHLSLQLNCSVPRNNNRREMIRTTLANHAVDATLARAIFDEITGAAVGAPLESLKIDPEINVTGMPDLDNLAWWVLSGWQCSRDDEGQVVVRQDCEERFGIRTSNVRLRMGLRRRMIESVDQEYKDVWNDMWPGGGGDWKDEWTSFPLQTRDLGCIEQLSTLSLD